MKLFLTRPVFFVLIYYVLIPKLHFMFLRYKEISCFFDYHTI